MGKQKDIDKGIAAIEKLKSSLMPESYEALIKLYKKKQKDLNIDIMKSAGGLGDLLGEGGRAGFDSGGSSIRKYTIPPKVWPLVVEMYEKAGGRGQTGMSLKEFAFQYFNKAKGGRVGFQDGTTMDLQYINPGFDTSEGMLSGVGGFPFVPATGLGILALSQKDKGKKKQPPQKTGGPNFPEPKPPFKLFDSIVDFIMANRRQPKPSEEGRLKEILRVAKEKAEGITSLFNENLHGINTQRFVESAKDAPQKLLEDLVDVEEREWDSKTGKETSTWKTYKRSDKTRPPTAEELEDDYGELWNDEQSPLDFGSTIEELDAALEEQHAYEEQMRREYYSGALDKYVKPEELEKQRLSRQKKIDKVLAKAYEEVFYQKPSSGDYKYDADVLADSIAEQLGKEPFDEMPVTYQRQIYDSALKRVQQDLGMKNVLKKIEQKMKLSDFDVKDRKKNAEGGIIGLAEGGPPSILNPPSKPKIPFMRKRSYPPGASSAAKRYEDQRLWERRKADEAFEGIWAGAPPSMKEREKMYRKERTARMMEEDRIEAFEKKMYDRRKLYPYAEMTEKEFAKAHPKVYDLMKKDPGWDWEIFKTISFANPGETFQATGAQEIERSIPLGMWSTSGRHDPGELELFMTPFGQTNYEMSSAGPFNKNKIMSDADKASVAIHEMRHKKILQDEELTAAQAPLAVEEVAWRSRDPSTYPIPTIDDLPEMVEPKAPPVYRHANPPGSEKEFSSPLGMHEVFNRFVNRQYSPLTTSSGPYFDKIWRDEWQPYVDKYEKILKKRKDPEEGLRVLANEGGIARRPNAVPPLSGPTPQGLTFLLGDDIVKSRSA